MSTANINDDLDETFAIDFDPSFGKPKGSVSLKQIEEEERRLYEEEQRAKKSAAAHVEETREVEAVPTMLVSEVGEQDESNNADGSAVPTLCDEEKKRLQDIAWQYLSTPASSSAATATDDSNKRHNSSPKSAVEAVKANDPSYTIVDLSGNTVFQMKHREYTEQLAEALRTNTYVKEVHLAKSDLDAKDAAALASALEQNDSVEVLDLEKNKISNDGATALANSLKHNKRLVELNLLGQPNQFGDACLETFIDLFDYNVTLTKIIWRLDSRKSFSINKLIVRNNTIYKWLQEGKDVSSKIPPKCFVKQLLILGNNSKPLATLRAEASAMSPSSPKVGRHTSGSVTSSPALSRHASPAPKSDPAEAAVVSVSRPVEVEASEPASISAPAVTVNSESPSSSSSDALLSLRNTSANSPSVLRKLRPSGSFTNSSDGEGSPDSTKTERRRSVLGSLRKGDAPSVVISAIEANDPATTVLNLEKNVSFAMKQQEFCQRLGAALKTNTHCREINLSGCSIDSTGAKLLAEGFANNKTLRVVDLSANKIGNDGSQAIAEALMTNCAINEINLLGQPGAFGESCLEVWLTMLSDYNISLRKIIWRLDSRKSFPINKLIVRNNTIKKFLDEGKDIAQGQQDGLFKVPDKCNCDVNFLKAD